MLTIESAKLIGTPGSSGWAQVHDFEPAEPEKRNARGHLFAVISTSKVEEGVETVSAGRDFLLRLHEEYFNDLSTKPFNALKNAVEKVSEEFGTTWGDVEVVASAIVDGIVYSAAGGGSRVLISREGSVGTILASQNDVVASSGFPRQGDMVLMASKTFFENVSQGAIKTALAGENCGEAINAFAPLRTTPDMGRLGVIVIRFKEKEFIQNESVVPASTTLNSFENTGKNIIGAISRFVRRLPQKTVYVRETMTDEAGIQSKKTTFSIAIILILILLLSVGFGINQKKNNDQKNKYQGLLTAAQNDVDQAIGLASANPEKSRELFYESEQKLKEILNLKIKDSKVNDLKNKIDTSRAAVLGEYLATSDLFLDLSLLSSGFRGDTVSASGGNIYVMDKNGKKIVSVAFSTKKSKVVAGPNVIDVALDLASYEDRVFILTTDGIYEVGTTKTKAVEKTWEGEALIKAFAGNIYVMDKAGNAIYRYVGAGNSFGEKQNWLSASTRVDFSNVIQWVIDGSAYVRLPGVKISKFSQGSPQVFNISGVVPEIGRVDAIYADADNTNIYLLDKAGKRVVVTDKKGKYIAQYINDQIANVTGLVVSEADKKIILLTGDKLFSIDIRHI